MAAKIRMTLNWLLANGTQGFSDVPNLRTLKVKNLCQIVNSDDTPILLIDDLKLLLNTCFMHQKFYITHKQETVNYNLGIRDHIFKCSFSGIYKPRGSGLRLHTSPKNDCKWTLCILESKNEVLSELPPGFYVKQYSLIKHKNDHNVCCTPQRKKNGHINYVDIL